MSNIINPNSFNLIVFREKTMFIKMKDIYPECFLYINKSPQLYPFICLKNNDCHVGMNCMLTLANRVKYIFDQFKGVGLLFLYFSYPDRPGSQRAGVFWRDFDKKEPKYMTFNRAAWERIKLQGDIYKWSLPNDLFMSKV